jgi:hypothetical protein
MSGIAMVHGGLMAILEIDSTADWIMEHAEQGANIPSGRNRKNPICVYPASVSRVKPDRTILQQDQAMSSGERAGRCSNISTMKLPRQLRVTEPMP